MTYEKIECPIGGEKITVSAQGELQVPNQPIIGFIEGDGIGLDITPVMHSVVNAAVKKAYGESRKIAWTEIYAGHKAAQLYGDDTYLPDETLTAIEDFVVAIKGPLMTPVGGGLRSLNAAMRQTLDLYVCLRPVRYFPGTPSPLKEPEKTDMVIFRENSEGIYTGVEWEAGSKEALRLLDVLQNELGAKKINFASESGIGIKHVSKPASQRLVAHAIQYAIDNNRPHVTLVHKGNIMKFTEGAFRDWGYEVAREQFGATQIDDGPWHQLKNPVTGENIIINDAIADAFLQAILLQPENFDVIATMNLNGDYISDALAAQVGGIGISPGANIGDKAALFEATHGTAPDIAGQNKANPGSIILSAEMMLRHMGWNEAADLILSAVGQAIKAKTVTCDLAAQMDDACEVSTTKFGEVVIKAIEK